MKPDFFPTALRMSCDAFNLETRIVGGWGLTRAAGYLRVSLFQEAASSVTSRGTLWNNRVVVIAFFALFVALYNSRPPKLKQPLPAPTILTELHGRFRVFLIHVTTLHQLHQFYVENCGRAICTGQPGCKKPLSLAADVQNVIAMGSLKGVIKTSQHMGHSGSIERICVS